MSDSGCSLLSSHMYGYDTPKSWHSDLTLLSGSLNNINKNKMSMTLLFTTWFQPQTITTATSNLKLHVRIPTDTDPFAPFGYGQNRGILSVADCSRSSVNNSLLRPTRSTRPPRLAAFLPRPPSTQVPITIPEPLLSTAKLDQTVFPYTVWWETKKSSRLILVPSVYDRG